MQPETRFKNKVQTRLREEFGFDNIWFFKTQERSVRGIPDIIGCVNSLFFAWELKVNAPVEPLQEYNLKEIGNAGGVSEVVTPENLDAKLAALMRRAFS